MATVDIGKVRRLLERYTALTATVIGDRPATSDRALLFAADQMVAYLPMLLTELADLRTRQATRGEEAR